MKAMCMKMKSLLLISLLVPSLTGAGCFGKGGGGGAVVPAAAPSMSAGSIVAGSVSACRAADGIVTARWRTSAPTTGNHLLAATLHFQERPLYSIVVDEPAGTPTTEHAVAVTGLPAGEPVRIAVTDGTTGLDDNAGRGYLAE